MKVSRPSPAMAVALLALGFSMTGTGIAAQSMISGKEIKDHSITSKDLAKGAVKAKNLAKNAVAATKLANGAVTRRSLASESVSADQLADGTIQAADIAPNTITSSQLLDGTIASIDFRKDAVELDTIYVDPAKQYSEASGILGLRLAPSIIGETTTYLNANWVVQCPNGTTSTTDVPCAPYAHVAAQNVPMNLVIGSCFIRNGYIPFPTLIARSLFAIFNPTPPNNNRLTATEDGMYTVTANATWAAPAGAAGTNRVLEIHKRWGPGPFEGQSKTMDDVVADQGLSEKVDQALTIQLPLEQGDSVLMSGGTCGANVAIEDASFTLERTGD